MGLLAMRLAIDMGDVTSRLIHYVQVIANVRRHVGRRLPSVPCRLNRHRRGRGIPSLLTQIRLPTVGNIPFTEAIFEGSPLAEKTPHVGKTACHMSSFTFRPTDLSDAPLTEPYSAASNSCAPSVSKVARMELKEHSGSPPPLQVHFTRIATSEG